MALLTSYETLTATTSFTIGNANIQSNGELTGTSANISGNIILDGGLGVIGASGDNLLVSWNNEDIVVRSVAGRVEVEADSDFVVNTNYDSGNALYSSRWVVTNNKIVNISGNAAIVSEAGDLSLSGGQDGVNSGNTTISAVNLGNAVYNWGFNNTGKLAIAGPSYANSPSNIYTSLNNGIALQPSWNQGGPGPTFLQGPGLDLHWNDGLFLTVSDNDYAQSEGNTSTVPFTISGPVTANGSVPVGALAITGGTNGTGNGDVNIGTSQTNVVRVKDVTFSGAGVDFSSANIVTLGPVGDVKITGGTSGQVLTTDGTGNLSFTTVSGGGNATPAGSNTQVQFNNAGAFGASSGLTFDNTSGNLNVSSGFVNAAAVETTGRIEVGTNLNVNGLTTLGAVANVSITGGSNGQVLTTNGSGNLSWTTPSNYGDSNVVTLLGSFGSNTVTTTGNITAGNLNSNGIVKVTTAVGGQGEFQVTDGQATSFIVGVGNTGATWAGSGSLNLITSTSPGGNVGIFVAQSETARFTTTGASITGNLGVLGKITGGANYVQPGFIQLNSNDANWTYGIDGDGATNFWLQAQFRGQNQSTRGFRVLENEGNTVVFSVNGSGNANVSGSLGVVGNISAGNLSVSGSTTLSGNVTANTGINPFAIKSDNGVDKIVIDDTGVDILTALTLPTTLAQAGPAPAAATDTTIAFKIPIVINGTTYYIALTAAV